LKVDLAIDIKL